MIATTRFGELHYKTYGPHDAQAVLLIHGFLEGNYMWQHLMPQLPQERFYIMPDLPGHGNSASVSNVHRMEMMAEMIHDLLQKLGVERCTVLGHSMGGYVALAFAELFPKQVEKLILYSSTTFDDGPRKINRDRAVEAVRSGKKSFLTQTVPGLFAPINVAKCREEIDLAIEKAAKMTREGIAASLLGMKERPTRSAVAKKTRNTVLIIGAEDPRIDPKAEEKWAIENGVKHHVISNAGHMAHFENSIALVKVLEEEI